LLDWLGERSHVSALFTCWRLSFAKQLNRQPSALIGVAQPFGKVHQIGIEVQRLVQRLGK
jgi:hypothetical protein